MRQDIIDSPGKQGKQEQETILLVLMPFWDPQIPPLGIACLKSYLHQHHYNVKSADSNLAVAFREIYDNYFGILRKHVPKGKEGNIYNIGNQVFRNHLTAHLHYQEKDTYMRLLKLLIANTFYCDFTDVQCSELENIIDLFYKRLEEYLAGLLAETKPTVLGLTVYGDTLAASMFAFKFAKTHDPSIKTVMGGGIFADQLAPGSPDLEFFLEKTADYIDKIIIGEGEALFLKFLRGEFPDSQRVLGLKDIGRETLNLTTVYVPDFSDFELQHYPHLAHYLSRSCPFQCHFCSETINWGKYRKKPVTQMVDEFTRLYEQYAYQLFLLTDSLLNPIVDELSAELSKSDTPIYWDGFLRADKHVCSIAKTLAWRKGGFYRAKLGIESGSPKVLTLMGKKITVAQIEESLFSLAHAGIKTTTFWLFGFPGETEQDFQLSLDLIEKLKDVIYEADCNPFNYYLTGQANSEEWLKNSNAACLYPPWARDMLITQTWVLKDSAPREEVFQRVNRFMAHIEKLGVPNPYSLKEICQADERWKKLHKNAVPSIVELSNNTVPIIESKKVEQLSFAQNQFKDENNWF